jgi:hypothetical protein
MQRIITLTTDFAADSHYVAQMKASILSINADAVIVDVTHGIAPQNIAQGALVAAEVCPQFPPASIHVIVVDPGVGADRRIVLARIGGHDYVAPDNGLLSFLKRRLDLEMLHEIREPRFWRPEVSATFHGRDIMAPVAAHLSLGVAPDRFGPPATALAELDWPTPTIGRRQIRGQVVLVDSFGNLISNISADDLRRGLPPGEPFDVACAGHATRGMCRTYGDRAESELVALVGSSGMLEVAVVCGSAAERLKAVAGEDVLLTW